MPNENGIVVESAASFAYVLQTGCAFSQRHRRIDGTATSILVNVLQFKESEITLVPPDNKIYTWKGDMMHELKPDIAGENQREFDELIRQRQEAIEHKKALEELVESLNGQIGAWMDLAGVRTVRSGDWQVTLANRTTPGRLSPERLLELGVPADTIAAAHTEGKPYTSVMVTRAKS